MNRIESKPGAMTTKHTCGGPVFGKRTAGCPRCDELAAGAAPVRWASRYGQDETRERFLANLRRAQEQARRDGTTCTYGEW